MLDKKKLAELHNDMLEQQKEELKEKYEYYILQLLNGQIERITENYFYAKAMIAAIESLNKLEKEYIKEKEIGEEKENE